MYLKKGSLIIRNATSNDAEILCEWWNSGKVMEHAGYPHGLGITPDIIIQDLLKDNDDTYRRMILEVDTIPIGEMSYRNKGNGVAEIGIKICSFEKQEKGLGTKFLRMLIHFLLWEKGYDKIILDTNVKNKRAQHVYTKIGFKQTSVKIDSWKNQIGELQSSICYELTRDDFKL